MPNLCSATTQVASCAHITPEEFTSQYRHKKPLILRQYAREWAICDLWREPVHLASRLNQDILVLRSPNNSSFLKCDCEQENRGFSDLVFELFGGASGASQSRLYGRAPFKDGLSEECPLASLEALAGGPVFKPDNCGVWLGSSNNVTPFHYDLCHGFLIQVVGTKTFSLVHPDEYLSLYPRPLRPEISQVDYDTYLEDTDGGATERKRHKKFAEAQVFTATLEPGDVMYTPPFWWHHVKTGDGPALSVLAPFDPLPSEPIHRCHLF